MDITLIFKVAGVGILISVLNMILTKVDRSRLGITYNPCRSRNCFGACDRGNKRFIQYC